jgi:prolyl-tRNA synthetase
MADAITKRKDDYAQWYIDVVRAAKLADYSPVRGCMIIRPNGMALWENMQRVLDNMFKETGHVNAYFPIFIPQSFLEKEAAHVEGFAKECAIVTHSRLTADGQGGLIADPGSRLEENMVIRPTSETIIWDAYGKWIQSWRDLPILINQWANIVRWEMRTRLFLRTSEFLWQEGHTAHETRQEAVEETLRMQDVYATFAEEYMAVPVLRGVKTESERFPGADDTYTIEAMMQNKWALQAGTSHFLGQNFAKAFDVKFQNRQNVEEYVWATSWGVSTRLVGAIVMSHSDDHGLVLPPKLAPTQAVVVPIMMKDGSAEVVAEAERITHDLRDAGVTVKLDASDAQRPGWKFTQYEIEGVPVRIALGPRDLANGTVEVARRDTREKLSVSRDGIANYVKNLLETIQYDLFNTALRFREENTTRVDSYDEFKHVLDEQGGFLLAHWDGSSETEAQIKEDTKATIRCIPLEQEEEDGIDLISGRPSKGRVVFGRAF